MSVLIKGMGMPKRGMVVNIYEDGRVTNHFDEFGKTIGKAVPIPTPHGRLGDLDELAKRIERERFHHTHTNGLAARHHISEYGHFLNAISEAPTVIPAADVRPVVLCKDCANKFDWPWCGMFPDEGYCSVGVRMDGDGDV